jgi:hypothetical protein
MPTLRLTDGTTITLPDDATAEEIAAILAAHNGAPQTPVETRNASDPIEGSGAPRTRAPGRSPRLSRGI